MLGGCQVITPTATTDTAIPQYTILASEYAFDVPDKIEAGLVSVTLDNVGHEPHHAQFARLNDGVTME